MSLQDDFDSSLYGSSAGLQSTLLSTASTAAPSSFSVPDGPPTALKKKSSGGKSKTIEERYQKKTPREHILLRPESYIGSVQSDTQAVWVWDDMEKRMAHRQITFCPGLYKIFDEILVNAADVKAREENEKVRGGNGQKMTCLKVDIDASHGMFSIFNDGEGIPIEIHKEHNIYVPELIFGHLLTSDNYDDTEDRVTGGRNGFGAKLANIFSKSFTVECADSTRQRKFRMTWKDNMTTKSNPSVTNYTKGDDYVKVTFTPDLQRFQMSSLDDGIVSLLTKRVYDVAGCGGFKVWLNGTRLMVKDFKSYVDLYLPSSKPGGLSEGSFGEVIKIHEKQPRWEVVISASEGQFQQVSFVNSICTTKGGSHVAHVLDPLLQAILKKVNTKNKGGMELKAHHVKQHIWVFVNCLIVNPAFDSQTKETLTLRASQFGSKFVMSDKTINAVVKSSIVESVLLWAKTKQQVELQKKMKGGVSKGGRDRVSGIPKLEDANDAGTRKGDQCTLILTEGDSAKTSCVAGLSVVGRDRYGVFPLRGKLLNVREASFKQQVDNAEIQAILKVMGLQVGKKFESPKGLRYGSLMIMTDQDYDGSHIKGLLINMVAHYWPVLLKQPGFLQEFVTPIVKVTRKKETLAFFTLVEYENWRRATDGGKGWVIKYYKGLGTSSDREFKEYFSQLERHTLQFKYDGEKDLDAIDMAFNGKRAEDRKNWIQSYQDGVFVDHSQTAISYSDFINKELVQFSKYDTLRSIPNCIDGLKPVQRKVLFAAFKRNLKNEVKVAQFTGYISEKTSYHHGEASLGTTIVGMAQNFVGSNNLNLLQPCGQFGSRKEGGKDASAHRYIFTRLTKVARCLFSELDDPLLEYQNDDGTMIEPKYYIPVIPLVLVNGAEGIGTGWSSSVPNYNPRDIVDNLRRFMRGEPMEPMTPWYRGFTGPVEKKGGLQGFEAVGRIEKLDEETLRVTELPVKLWTQNFKMFLEELLPTSEKNEKLDKAAEKTKIKRDSTSDQENDYGGGGRSKKVGGAAFTFTIVDYRDDSSHEHINFTIKVTPATMKRLEKEGLEKAFKLRRSIGTSNMTLFDQNLKVQKYSSELDIIREFGGLRLQFYQVRKAYMLEKLERERRLLKNKVRFIEEIIAERLRINNRKKKAIVEDLVSMKFDRHSAILRASEVMWRLEEVSHHIEEEKQKAEEAEEDEAAGDVKLEDRPASFVEERQLAKDFEYLLGMSLWSLSLERIEELRQQLQRKLDEMAVLTGTAPETLWDRDIDRLLEAMAEQDAESDALRQEDAVFKTKRRASLKALGGGRKKGGGRGGSTVKAPKGGRAKVKRDDSESEVSSDESSDSFQSTPTLLSDEDSGPDDNSGGGHAGSRPQAKASNSRPQAKSKPRAAASAAGKKKATAAAPLSSDAAWSSLASSVDISSVGATALKAAGIGAFSHLKTTPPLTAVKTSTSPRPSKDFSLAQRLKARAAASSSSSDFPVRRQQQTLDGLLGLSSPEPSEKSSGGSSSYGGGVDEGRKRKTSDSDSASDEVSECPPAKIPRSGVGENGRRNLLGLSATNKSQSHPLSSQSQSPDPSSDSNVSSPPMPSRSRRPVAAAGGRGRLAKGLPASDSKRPQQSEVVDILHSDGDEESEVADVKKRTTANGRKAGKKMRDSDDEESDDFEVEDDEDEEYSEED